MINDNKCKILKHIETVYNQNHKISLYTRCMFPTIFTALLFFCINVFLFLTIQWAFYMTLTGTFVFYALFYIFDFNESGIGLKKYFEKHLNDHKIHYIFDVDDDFKNDHMMTLEVLRKIGNDPTIPQEEKNRIGENIKYELDRKNGLTFFIFF